MKSAFGWIVVLLLLIGGGGGGLYHYHNVGRQTAYEQQLTALKHEFLVNTTPLYLLDLERYRKEIGPHLNRYFKQLNKLAKDYPESYDPERERRNGEERLERGQISEETKMQRDERIDIVMDLFNRMMSGQYRPLYSQSAMNFRFDIYDVAPARVGGDHKVKFSHVHWAPFPSAHKPNTGPVSYKGIVGNIKGEQKKGKPAELQQLLADAQPPSLQISPERWVAEFPPGMEIGFYDLPQFPSNANSLDLSFDFGIRTIGGSDLFAHIQFPEMAIPEAWKIPEGQKWEGQERFASDEELQAAGVEPTQ